MTSVGRHTTVGSRGAYGRRAARRLSRGAYARRRVVAVTTYAGAYVGSRPRRPFFLPRRTQHMKTWTCLADWLGGGAMLLGVVSGGLLLALLAA
jgi:hypothetical protein